MCGICGIYHPRERPSYADSALRRMTSAMIHRGPDEEGYFESGQVSLGMRRLRVMDLAGGSQPVTNEHGSLQAIFNGEIYDFERCKAKLEARGHVFRSSCDTEVLVHLYEEYGHEMLNEIDGMFAFAIWDAERSTLFLARDRFGIKPLYYTAPDSQGAFAFASELTSLRQYPAMSRALDPIAIDQFFAFSYVLHPRSIFLGTSKAAPGSFITADEKGLREQVYWRPTLVRKKKTLETACYDLDQALADSVRSMARSDVPLGAFLSGGLDSSAVVYHLQASTARTVKTFCVRYENASFDEGREAKLIANRLGTDHHEVWVTPEQVALVPSLVASFGEPFADPSLLPTFVVSKLARSFVTVALSGDGGDELLGGYQTYVASALAQKAARLPHFLQRVGQGVAAIVPTSMERTSFDYKLKRFMRSYLLAPRERHVAWKEVFTAEERRELYSEEFRAHYHERSLADLIPAPSPDSDSPLDGSLADLEQLDMQMFLTDNNLVKVDRMSMATSLEVRVPFLDMRVAQAAFEVPDALQIRRGTTKYLLRTIMRSRLPAPITKMSKKGFHVPLAEWFQGPLLSSLKETLSPERVGATGILNAAPVQRLLAVHSSGQANVSRPLWSLYCFMHWCEASGVTG